MKIKLNGLFEEIIESRNEAIETVLSELENKQDDINILQAQRDSIEYQFKQAKAELEKKDDVIDEMADWITKIEPTIYCDKSKCDENCKECVIKGFTNKVEREGK